MSFLKRPVWISVIVISVIILGGYFIFSGGKKSEPEFITVKRGAILQEVSVVGNVKPVKSVDLAFEKSGKISFVLAEVGDYVSSGATLVGQDSSELYSQLEKANADLETQKAEFNKSEIVLDNYYSAVANVLNDAYNKADDAVRKQVDSFFTDGESDTPKLNFTTTNSQAQTDSQNGRLTSRTGLDNWRSELSELNAGSRDELNLALLKAESHLGTIRDFLLDAMDALEKANNLSAATLDSYKANLTTARTNINTALTNISDQKQSINLQGANIISEEVSIRSYEASVGNIEAQIAKTTIRSPISGVVTKQDAKVGEIAAANSVLVSVLSSIYEIEAFIPEVDIAKIKIGDSAKTTLDAYGRDVVFEAKVTFINPAETMVEGVATYKTVLRLDSGDRPIKSGMTANLDILTAQKNDALIIPQRAVTSANGDKFVNIGATTIKVVTGLRGSDGNIEILEGLKEGDKIVISQ
ncbi:MAG: HlyD family efflux transporter periplasmic adaptor subunit [Candidatus Azambacteria bacterium]|nr:HlyD family efflux transporter periplasmic adaptor subunit [Candidatus Azambacteria bacterium]